MSFNFWPAFVYFEIVYKGFAINK